MTRQKLSLVLALMFMVSFCLDSYVNAEPQNEKYYDLEQYQKDIIEKSIPSFLNTSSGDWYTYFTNKKCHPYMLLKDRIYDNEYNFLISIGAGLIQDGNIFKTKESSQQFEIANYETALFSLLQTMQYSITTDEKIQSSVDQTKKWYEYVLTTVDASASAFADFLGDSLEELTIKICSKELNLSILDMEEILGMLKSIDNHENFQILAVEVNYYQHCMRLLNLLENQGKNHSLAIAASNVKQFISVGYAAKIKERSENISEGATDTFESFLLTDLYSYISSNQYKTAFIKIADFLSGIINCYNSLADGIKLGYAWVDIPLKSTDMYLRYYEACAMVTCHEVIISAASDLIESPIKTVDEAIQLQSYLYDLLHIIARGNYCVYALQHTGWLSAKYLDKSDEEGYVYLCEYLNRIKAHVDNLIPDFNNYELSYAEWANLSANYPAEYNNILDMFYTSIVTNWSSLDDKGEDDLSDPDNVCYLFYHPDPTERTLDNTGYAITDLDSDGKPELIVSPMNGSEIYDLYTITDNNVKHLLSFGERDRFYLLKDLSIINEWAESASCCGTVHYKLNDGELIGVKEVVSVPDQYNVQYWADTDYYTKNFKINTNVMHPISEVEGERIINSFPEKRVIELVSFKNYKPSTPLHDSSLKTGFIFPDSDSRLLNENEVKVLDKDSLDYALNEIYARRGFIFSKDKYKSKYMNEPWYTPISSDMNSIQNTFNNFEKVNSTLISKYRKLANGNNSNYPISKEEALDLVHKRYNFNEGDIDSDSGFPMYLTILQEPTATDSNYHIAFREYIEGNHYATQFILLVNANTGEIIE